MPLPVIQRHPFVNNPQYQILLSTKEGEQSEWREVRMDRRIQSQLANLHLPNEIHVKTGNKKVDFKKSPR
jgi:hypothetical protein